MAKRFEYSVLYINILDRFKLLLVMKFTHVKDQGVESTTLELVAQPSNYRAV